MKQTLFKQNKFDFKIVSKSPELFKTESDLTNEIVIKFNNLSKTFKHNIALNDVSFEVYRNTIHGFIGPNGSGKTTTLKALLGLIYLDDGEILVNDISATSVKAKKFISYIPEESKFPKNISLYKYLLYACMMSGFSYKLAKQHVLKIIKLTGLASFARYAPYSFSSGMKKKVLIAQALLSNPEVIILDEPTANLDPTARIQLIEDLKLLKQLGKTILISSHVLTELQDVIDNVTILNYGDIVYDNKVFYHKDNYYEIVTNEKDKLIEYLEEQRTEYILSDESIIIKSEEDAVDIVSNKLKSENITFLGVNKYITNLVELYKKVIMD